MHNINKFADAYKLNLTVLADPTQWNGANVLSWLQWTSQEFGFTISSPEQWDMNGAQLIALTEEDFVRRSPQVSFV